MLKALVTGLSLLAFAPSVAFADTETAREAQAEGRWDAALEAWESAAKAPDATLHAWTGYLEAMMATGRTDRLAREAEAAAERFPGWALPRILVARTQAAEGRPEEALATLGSMTDPGALAERASILTVLGRRDEATRVWGRLLDLAGSRVESPRHRVALGHAARATGRYQQAARLYETAYRDSLDYVEARLSLAYLFREKHQATLAGEELGAAASIAPAHPDVFLAAARLNLLGNSLSRAQAATEEVLALRPRDTGSLKVQAWLALIADNPRVARELLAEPLERNPYDREARSLLTAAYYLEGDSTAYHAETDRVLAQDPGYLDVHVDLATILEKSRRNEEAFALYRRVLAADPEHADAHVAMGLLYMREGDEVTARGYLEQGFEGDPFNIRAYNQLELLDFMDTFTSYPSEHFDVRLEAAADSLLVPMLHERLERMHAELTDLHGWAPPEPTIVEVFPSHDWFSARVTGLPWIGGIPAVCFGHVVAMDSPRTLSGSTNWEDVLRHEYGHVLALGMTRKQVPFWFTEGLSVHLEQYPRGQGWDANLVASWIDGELLSVDSLTIGFTRAKDFNQRLLAYHSSGLILDDIVAEHGWKAIPAMLERFGRGEGLDRAVRDVLDQSPEEFRARALRVIRDEAASLPVWPRPSRQRLVLLEARAQEEQEDPELLGRLGVCQLQLDDLAAASETAKKLLGLDPDNPLAEGLLGLLDLRGDRDRSAEERLSRAIELGSTDLPVYLGRAQLALAEDDTLTAMTTYRRALEVYPYLTEARHRLARLLAATGDIEAAIDEYRELITLDSEAAAGALELARLELEREEADAAEATLTYATTIVPLHADVEALMGQAMLLQDRDREAYDRFLFARKLDLKSIEAMVGMGLYYLKQEDYEEAAFFAELALKYDPTHRVARRILAEAHAG